MSQRIEWNHTEYYEKPCPCKKGKVKWAKYEKWSSGGGIDHFPVEILCPICKKTHEIKIVQCIERKRLKTPETIME